MKDVALITLHGMGKVKDEYYADLEDGLKNWLGGDWSRVSFHKVQYAPILQTPKDKLWKAIKSEPENDIDATKLRQFFLYGFGDAGSLEYSAHRDDKKYVEVQQEIQRALKDAYADLNPNGPKHVVIIAQSLGCQVISNYLWDAKKNIYIFDGTAGDTTDEIEFLRLRSLRNLVTTGCNIPLFVSGISNRKCFGKPNSKFAWDNYYGPDDVLGWPLRQLGKSFEFINDHHINAGGMFSSWNPLSHGKYWSDKDVIRPLANTLLNLLP
jgi:hypothetical protein